MTRHAHQIASVSEIPAKASVYGSLVGLLNESNNDIVAQLMDEFNTMLIDSVDASDWFKFKKLLRFYGELVNANVIRPGSYCDLINDLLDGLEVPNQPRVCIVLLGAFLMKYLMLAFLASSGLFCVYCIVDIALGNESSVLVVLAHSWG